MLMHTTSMFYVEWHSFPSTSSLSLTIGKILRPACILHKNKTHVHNNLEGEYKTLKMSCGCHGEIYELQSVSSLFATRKNLLVHDQISNFQKLCTFNFACNSSNDTNCSSSPVSISLLLHTTPFMLLHSLPQTDQHLWRSSSWKHPPVTFHISWKPRILQPAFMNNIATRWKWKMWIPCSTNLLSHLMISGTCSSNRLKNASSSAGSTHVSRSSSSSHPLQCLLRHLLYTISLPNVYAIVQLKLHLLEQMKL